MHCALYDADRCRSCQWLTLPYPQQLRQKQDHLQALLTDITVGEWRSPVSSPQQAFRNKAKMVVSGSVERPVLGIVQRDGNLGIWIAF